jgi:hypothetical protein
VNKPLAYKKQTWCTSLRHFALQREMPMTKKKDPSITFLNKFGYNVIKFPRAGIEPMDVIGKDDTTQWLGPMHMIWSSTIAEPAASAPRPAGAVNGQKSDALDLSFGIKILANALAAFGASVPSLDTAYHRASKVQFAYTGVTSTVVAPFDAGNYLTAGTLKADNPVVRHYFLDQQAEAYLIVDVLKSNSVTVTATDEHGVVVGVDVPAIQGLVGANVKVSPSGAANSTITFTGSVPVSFGFSVQQIRREGDQWSLSGVEAGGNLSFGTLATGVSSAPDESAGILLGSDCLLEI